jgi:hypothetical protein
MILGDIKGKDGLAWEFDQLLSMKEREKVVLVVPPVAEAVVERRWFLCHELSGGRIPTYQGGEVAARLSLDGSCVVTRFGCRQDGDYLVALGDLLGLPPVSPKMSGGGREARVWWRDIHWLLTHHNQADYSDSLRLDGGKRPPQRPPSWIEGLGWRVDAARSILEIREPLLAPDRVCSLKRELREIEDGLNACRQRWAVDPERSIDLLPLQAALKGRFEKVKDELRLSTQLLVPSCLTIPGNPVSTRLGKSPIP